MQQNRSDGANHSPPGKGTVLGKIKSQVTPFPVSNAISTGFKPDFAPSRCCVIFVNLLQPMSVLFVRTNTPAACALGADVHLRSRGFEALRLVGAEHFDLETRIEFANVAYRHGHVIRGLKIAL